MRLKMHRPATIRHRFRCHDHGHRDALHSSAALHGYAVLMHVESNARVCVYEWIEKKKTEERMKREDEN